MTETTPGRFTQPVNGKAFQSFKITSKDPRNLGNRTLANRWRAMEMGHREIAETYGHPLIPGIRIVDLYKAPDGTNNIYAAKAHDPSPTRFLLSKAGVGIYVVSSRIGYDEHGKVDAMPADEIFHPQYNDIEFYLHDFAFRESSHPGVLIDRHSQTVFALGGDVVVPFAQNEADFAFKAMVAGCDEIR